MTVLQLVSPFIPQLRNDRDVINILHVQTGGWLEPW